MSKIIGIDLGTATEVASGKFESYKVKSQAKGAF